MATKETSNMWREIQMCIRDSFYPSAHPISYPVHYFVYCLPQICQYTSNHIRISSRCQPDLQNCGPYAKPVSYTHLDVYKRQVSAMVMAMKISTQPTTMRPLIHSPKNSMENSAPNTDSMDRSNDVVDGFVYFWQTFCRRNASIVLPSPR